MAKAQRPVPEGFRTLTLQLTVAGAAKYIDFLTRAFGAVEVGRAPGPDGRLIHALIRVGDAVLMLHDDFPEYCGGTPIAQGRWPLTLQLYVPDADAAFARAVDAGCQVLMPPSGQFWGDRYAQVKDPFGFTWAIATRMEDLTPEELRARQAAAFGG